MRNAGSMGAGLAAILCLTPTMALAQDEPEGPPAAIKPVLPQVAGTISAFVPKRWTLERRANGDLNGDGLPDAALVIRSTYPKLILDNPSGFGGPSYNSNPRTIIVLLAQRGGRYRRVGMSNDIIPRVVDTITDDPFVNKKLSIEGGVLKLSTDFFASAGTWSAYTTIFTFRYQKGAVYMIGYDKDYVHRGSGEHIKTSVNFLTGQKRVWTGFIDTEEEKFDERDAEITHKNLGRKPLIRLEDVGDGWQYDPDPLPAPVPDAYPEG